MQINTTIKIICTAGIALLIMSCSNRTKEKVKIQEVTLQDIKQEEKIIEPPPPPPPKDSLLPAMEIKGGKTKCFVNDGLKYKTTVTLAYNDHEAMGIVSSEELETGKKSSAAFEGTREGDGFSVSFKQGDPPVIGDASEWINKPWSLKKNGTKETLHIMFNAKNYETNKWGETDYLFEPVDCK